MPDAEDDLMSDRVVSERFQGFTDGALDGYAAGVAARRIGGPAEANLRALPPLDRELSIEVDGERAVLRDGDTVVIELTATGFELEIPAHRRWRRPRRRAAT
jgi:hypothetical protein